MLRLGEDIRIRLPQLAAATRRMVARLGGPHGITLLGLACVAAIWVVVVYDIAEERRAVERHAQETTLNLARVFEENIGRLISGVDQTLRFVREVYVRDPAGFDVRPWARAGATNEIAFQISVIDRTGRLVTSNLDPTGTSRVDLRDREHVRVHLEGTEDILFISRPVVGRVSNQWSINISRRISGPDGRILGVAVVSIDPVYLTRLFDSIEVGRRGMLSLVGTDGIIRIWVGSGTSTLGREIGESALFGKFMATPTGTSQGHSVIDGIERIFSHRKVRDLPLIVVAGLATSEVYAAADHSRMVYLAVAVVLTLGMLIVISMIYRYQRGLEEATVAAEAAVRTRSDFIAVMSHEIRTPLNGVIGMAGLLLDSGLSGERARYAATLRESAEHLLHLVDDVLDFSKLDAGRLELEEIVFDLPALIEGTARAVAPRAAAKGLVLATVLSPDLPSRVLGDPGRVRQILLNLLNNGIKFTERGGVTVDVGVVASRTVRRVGIAIDVVDSGIGIAPDAMSRLFTEFHQADSSVSRRFGGTGLGLAICKRLVDRMNGTITVDSSVGSGSSFRVTIDLGLPEADTSLLGGALGGSPRVLVIDRNPVSRPALVRQLVLLGAEASAANTAEVGITMAWDAAVAARPFALVAVDETATTDELVAALRTELCMTAATRLALLTSTPGQERAAGALGTFDIVLGKPLTYEALRRTLGGAPASETVSGGFRQAAVPLGVLHPLRILVAEDNPTNQLVAQKLLEGLGYGVDLVADGAAAVAAVREKPYDIVFMDVMMPVMDGLKATRAIRALPAARRIHIVALTANAFRHDAEICRAAGMDDFVGKPITRDRLEAAIRRYLDHGGGSDVAAAVPASPALPVLAPPEPDAPAAPPDVLAPPPALDRAVFAEIASEIGEEGARQVLTTFLADSPARIDRLREGAATGRALVVEHEAHTLKGAAGTLGLLRLADLARRLEEEARAGRTGDFDALVTALSAALDELSGTFDQRDAAA
jgi:signal transduction histidine kinase/DNA-binding NarL/FixJ family response regulator/HPt (histidine-containing phosphotransfer) domain-containing protein